MTLLMKQLVAIIKEEDSSLIVQLMEQNWFSNNFGLKKNLSEFHRHNIAEKWIRIQIQIQNKLSSHCLNALNFNNEITLLQDKARWSISTGEEAADQPFVFPHDVDDINRLVLIDF
jgi:hypothetical protein